MALKYTMECTGATAVSLSLLSQTHDCLVVLARRGPQNLVLPPGSCIAITEPGEAALSLDNPEQHSLQHLYASASAVVACVREPRTLTGSTAGNANGGGVASTSASGLSGGLGAYVPAGSLPLDWAHLHKSAGITHFAALPLYHGTNLAGALTILGASPSPLAAPAVAAGALAAPASSISLATTAAGLTAPLTGPVGQPLSSSCLDELFRSPPSLEVAAMAVAQCCLGADMALARHAVEMVQAMHACASIQQLVGGISLGLQALMQARFCLTLRCNVALAVEFMPNAIMFEDVPGATAPSGSGGIGTTSTANFGMIDASGGQAMPQGLSKASHTGTTTGRSSITLNAPSPQQPREQQREAALRMGSGGLGGGGEGRQGFAPMRSGIDMTGEPMWAPSSGHVTASVLLNQIVGRRYKARPFSVYHTLLIRTIHELASSSHGGTVITQCHDHMQDAKTPSRDIYALGRGVGQPPQSLVLSVTHLRPANDARPDSGSTARDILAAAEGGTSGEGGGNSLRSHRLVRGSIAALGPDGATGDGLLRSSNPALGNAAGPTTGDSSNPPVEPRTYIGLYLTSAEPLPSALLELILVEVHSLACHVLSPLVYRKLLVGELAMEWSFMKTVTSSSLPQGSNTDSVGAHSRQSQPRQGPAGAATPGAAAAVASAAGGVASPSMSAGSTACASVLAGMTIPELAAAAGDATPGLATGGRSTSALGTAAATPDTRMSSLQRIMAPFLMADMSPIDATQPQMSSPRGGGATGTGGTTLPLRRSSDAAIGGAAASSARSGAAGDVATGPSTNGGAAAEGGGGSRSLDAGTGTAVGIRRMLAGGGGGGGTGTSGGDGNSGRGGIMKSGRGSMSCSEGLARDMMLAAAAASVVGPGGGPFADKFLSTEVAMVQDTHSQMGLLVTSYKETLHNMHMELSVGAVQRQSLDLHADDPGRLFLREVLGKGGHGVVFRGSMHSLEVAIKVFQTPGEDEPLAAGTANRPEVLAETLLQRRRVLTRAALELALMSSISHPNIVQVYAQWPTALLERDETQPCRRRLRKLPPDTPPPVSGGLVCAVMVMEYCDKGTLVDAINRGDFVSPARDGSGFKANYRAIYTTLLEVALALRHLASMAVTHCDVKPANILLRSSPRDPRGFTAKLADFGYAALLRDSSPDGHRSVVTDEACGTVTHMAPESFVEGEPVDSSADVYAFGILMWELISGKQPYHDRNLKQLPHEVVNKGLRPTFPPNTPEVYKSLAKSCWSPLPRSRPTAAQVVQSIQTQLDKIEAVARLLGKP